MDDGSLWLIRFLFCAGKEPDDPETEPAKTGIAVVGKIDRIGVPFQGCEQADMKGFILIAEIIDNRMKKDFVRKLFPAHILNALFRKDPFCFVQADFFVHQIPAYFQRIGFDFWPLIHALIVAEHGYFDGTEFRGNVLKFIHTSIKKKKR